jgi:hypothetical protein
MRKKSWLTLLSVSLTLIVAATVVWTAKARGTGAGLPASKVRDDDSLRDELASTRLELRQLQRTVAALASRMVPAPAGATAPDAPAPEAQRPRLLDPQARIAAAKERTEQRYAFLQKSFDGEAPDPEVTGKVRDRLIAGLAAPIYAGFAVDSVECRATMCSAVIAVLPAANDLMVGQLVAIPEVSGAAYRRMTRADGGASVVAFLARAGHKLPHLADGR